MTRQFDAMPRIPRLNNEITFAYFDGHFLSIIRLCFQFRENSKECCGLTDIRKRGPDRFPLISEQAPATIFKATTSFSLSP